MKTRMGNGLVCLLAGLMLVGLLFFTARTAWAAGPEPEELGGRRPTVVRGRVMASDGDALTVETPRGEITLLTDGRTRYRIPGVESSGLADLQVSDQIAAEGHWERQGVFYARLILLIPDDARLLRGAVGEVGDDVLTLATDEGNLNVLTDDKTRYFIPGVEQPALTDLVEGMTVTVAGLQDESGNIVARAIRALVGHTRGLAQGRVLAVSTDGFQLKTRRGVIDLQADGATFFVLPGVEEPGLGDLTEGARALVAWQKTEDGGLLAKMVFSNEFDQGSITDSSVSVASHTRPSRSTNNCRHHPTWSIGSG